MAKAISDFLKLSASKVEIIVLISVKSDGQTFLVSRFFGSEEREDYKYYKISSIENIET